MRRVTLFLMATTLFPGATGAAGRPEGHSFATRSVVHAKHGMVVGYWF